MSLRVLVNWANALYRQARMLHDSPRGKYTLLKLCIDKYLEALNIYPEHAESMNNWGKALTFQQKIKQDVLQDDYSTFITSVDLYIQVFKNMASKSTNSASRL
jgi:hypothetical protein